MTRRRFANQIGTWAGVVAAAHVDRGGLLFGQAGQQRPNEGPLVTSLDLSLVDDWLTPNELFFNREHFVAPRLSFKDWAVAITGAVERPREISYTELLERPRIDLPVTLECAGNPVGGGMIGNAEWSGARLGELLREAGVLARAEFVRFVGADGGPGEPERYSRSIPLTKALHADTLLAYGMNGEVLPRRHGFPVRAIVPGWYGMDSVKWLQRIEILTEPDNSPLMTQRYLREVRQNDGSTTAQTVAQVQVKSAFSRPLDGAVLFGRRFPVRGIAWAGEQRVKAVQISTDVGASWNTAELIAESRSYSWVQWKYDWNIPEPGNYVLLVRATDDRGNIQPAERSPDRRDVHELNHYQRVKCTVV